jgi:hypothetical protein
MEADKEIKRVKKEYEKPEIKVTIFQPENICTSGGGAYDDMFGMFGSTYQ